MMEGVEGDRFGGYILEGLLLCSGSFVFEIVEVSGSIWLVP